MKRYVFDAKDPLKHLLLILENDLFDPVLSERMDVFADVMVLVGRQVAEVIHLLFQVSDLFPQSLLHFRLPCRIRLLIGLQVLLPQH